MGFLFGSSKCSANIDILKTQPRGGEHLQTVDVAITTLLRVIAYQMFDDPVGSEFTDEVVLVKMPSKFQLH